MRAIHLPLATFAVSFLLLFSLFLSPASAVTQPAGTIKVEIFPGDSAEVLWALFSDHTFNTTLAISSVGGGSEFLSFDKSLNLSANGVVYSKIRIAIPTNYSGFDRLNPTMHARETTNYQGDTFDVAEIKNTLEIIVKERETSATTTDTTTSSGTSTTSSETSTNQTTTKTTSTANNTTSPAPVTTMTTVANYTQTGQVSVSDDDEREDEEEREERTRRPASVFKKIAKQLEDRRESKIAEAIREAGVRADLVRADVKKVEVNLTAGLSGRQVNVTINTLAISRVQVTETETGEAVEEVVENETTDTGVVRTPARTEPTERVPETEREVFIEVTEDVRLPDIERRVVSEEIVRETPAGEVVRRVTSKKAYRYLEIDLAGVESDEIERTAIEFDVEKSWLADNNVQDPSLVTLNRFVYDWVELPTTLIGEDATSYKYSAETEGFSFFVITAAITADITTPISIEVPEAEEQVAQDDDLVGDLLGTTKPQPLLIINISWLLAVVAIGIVILLKYNAIKSALSRMHARKDEINRLRKELKRYETIKEKTTKRFYKRAISEDEFKSLIREYDKEMIRIEAQIEELEGKK